MKPVIADAILQSIRLLADGADSFRERCIDGMEVDRARVAELLERSLMLVTALVPEIGYDRAAAIARLAHGEGLTLLEAALRLGHIGEERFRQIVVPAEMT
jgi:fumarate hydratase class II